jgi:hypothetical protein
MYSYPAKYLNHYPQTDTLKRETNMKTSESIKNLTKSLLKAQTQMGSAKKDSKNPFFKSTYADLPTVMEVVKAPLNDAGIIVLQPASNRDGKNFITTTLIHGETGEFMSSETEVVCAKANDPQAFGAAQTYARRFGLQAMLFIPAEDDDGNYASGKTSYRSNSTEAKATTTATIATASAQDAVVASESEVKVEPLKRSMFRKQKTVAESATTKAVVSASSATVSEEDWA